MQRLTFEGIELSPFDSEVLREVLDFYFAKPDTRFEPIWMLRETARDTGRVDLTGKARSMVLDGLRSSLIHEQHRAIAALLVENMTVGRKHADKSRALWHLLKKVRPLSNT